MFQVTWSVKGQQTVFRFLWAFSTFCGTVQHVMLFSANNVLHRTGGCGIPRLCPLRNYLELSHPFMTLTRESGFWPPPPLHMCPHEPGSSPPCGRPHAIDMKYTLLSRNS